MTPPPIRIPCEGSHQPGHTLEDGLLLCAMCGHRTFPYFTPLEGLRCPPHDRDDIISMLQRGDFD